MIAMMAAIGKPAELRVHLKGALKNGCPPEQIREILLLVALYCGIPASIEAHKVAVEVLRRQRLPLVEDRIRARLDQLSARLGDADWLDGAFSAGDLMMVSVLLRLKSSGILDEYPNLATYVARGEARPAYKRAFDAQLAVFIAASNG